MDYYVNYIDKLKSSADALKTRKRERERERERGKEKKREA